MQESVTNDEQALARLRALAGEARLQVAGGTVRRSSSRFCLGVEHGDYNGTELFGVGTDRFIWVAARPNDSGRLRFVSGNFPEDGVIDFESGQTPGPRSPAVADSWARFALGVDWVLRRAGYRLERGLDAVVLGNIPGGGMSRSASLSLNLILTVLEANRIPAPDPLTVVDLAQAVENDYIGSPCGQLDQIMILFARAGMGTHYAPRTRTVTHVPLGPDADDFRLLCLDTGTVRPGLEKSTYRVRRAECEELVARAAPEFHITCLADVQDETAYRRILERFQPEHPHLCRRLAYIYQAGQRFTAMLEAWKAGRMDEVGALFRADGLGLRDLYEISGPELESMCDIVRTVPGVLGERMLGGGDKGAAGALVRPDAVEAVRAAVATAYPRSRPHLADRHAVHALSAVDGMVVLEEPA